MIYSRWGSGIRVTGYCGKHQIEGYGTPLMLVRAVGVADGQERFYLAWTLRADGGIKEVEAAIDAAPEVILDEATLAKAIEQAL
jgi:hypothetical protein